MYTDEKQLDANCEDLRQLNFIRVNPCSSVVEKKFQTESFRSQYFGTA